MKLPDIRVTDNFSVLYFNSSGTRSKPPSDLQALLCFQINDHFPLTPQCLNRYFHHPSPPDQLDKIRRIRVILAFVDIANPPTSGKLPFLLF